MKKSTIIIITAIIVLLLGVILGALFSNKKAAQKQESTLATFSTNFIKDFTTYKVTNEKEYNNKVLTYIDTDYKVDFLDTYKLPKSEFLSEEKKNNYSEYVESKITVIEETDTSATLKISYKAKKVDAPARPTEFIDSKTVAIVVKKSGKKFGITNFSFSNNE